MRIKISRNQKLTLLMALILSLPVYAYFLPLYADILSGVSIVRVVAENCSAASWEGFNISSSGTIVEAEEDISIDTYRGIKSLTAELAIDGEPVILTLVIGDESEFSPMEALESLDGGEDGVRLIYSSPALYNGTDAAYGLFNYDGEDMYILTGSVEEAKVLLIAPRKQMFNDVWVVPE